MGRNEDLEKDEFKEKTEHNSKLLDTLSIIRFHISKHYSYDGRGGDIIMSKVYSSIDPVRVVLKLMIGWINMRIGRINMRMGRRNMSMGRRNMRMGRRNMRMGRRNMRMGRKNMRMRRRKLVKKDCRCVKSSKYGNSCIVDIKINACSQVSDSFNLYSKSRVVIILWRNNLNQEIKH